MNPGLVCPGLSGRHHPDKTGRDCTDCKQRIYDTIHGWMTKQAKR